MSSNRIGGVNSTPTYVQLDTRVPLAPTTTTTPQATTPVAKPGSVNLFDASTYAKSVNVQDGAGSAINLPTLSDEQVAQAQNLFSKVDAEKQGEVNAASSVLGQALVQQMLVSQPAQLASSDDSGDGTVQGPKNISMLGGLRARAATGAATGATSAGAAVPRAATSSGISPNATANKVSPALTQATAGAVSTYSRASGGATNGSDAVNAATYMGLVGLQGELANYANEMSATTEQKKALGKEIADLNLAISEWPAGTDKQELSKVTPNDDGTFTITKESMTKESAKASLAAAKGINDSLGSDQQLQSMNLQQMMSQYSNAVNMMSNILKAGYDAGKNTLGNIHY